MNIDNYLKHIIENPASAIFYTPSCYKDSVTYLFTEKPQLIVTADKSNFNDSLKEIDSCIQKEYSGFGFINYETGYLLENKLNGLLKDSTKNLMKFFFYYNENVRKINSAEIDLEMGEKGKDFTIENFQLNTSHEEFLNAIKKIHHYIAEGDTYQVNYTLKGKFTFNGDLIAFFKQLIFNQSAKYSAFINTGDSLIISLSPELFFSAENQILKTRPMKGTLQRGYNKSDDSLAVYSLRNSEKNRAENLMILDLLRNDMGKISEFGSVRLRKLFAVEKYETLLQMTSGVESVLREEISFGDIIKNIFPCGSVTGAPKISTIKIINEIEKEERGIYTGAVGLIYNEKKIFNVAIRTIHLEKNNEQWKGEMGIGSGIVWDSDPEKEYEEVLLKSNFLLKPFPYFELFETMKFTGGQFERLDLHLKRLKESASYFLFKYDEEMVIQSLNDELTKYDTTRDYRVKLSLNKWGNIKIEVTDIPATPGKIKIIISDKIILSENRFQYFKTTNRELYNSEYKKYSDRGFFDVIFINEKNQITEGAITNIFINKTGLLYTPPVSSGILPGVFRKYWLQTNINIKEEILYKDDLLIADEIILTNSLRGMIKVDKLYLNESEYIEFRGVPRDFW